VHAAGSINHFALLSTYSTRSLTLNSCSLKESMTLLRRFWVETLRKTCFHVVSVPRVFRCFASQAIFEERSGSRSTAEDAQIIPYSDTALSQDWYRGENRVDVARDILDALALEFAYIYVFEHDEVEGPNMREVLRAKNGSMGEDWDYIRYAADGYYEDFRDPYEVSWEEEGDPVIGTPLAEVISESDWILIEKMLECVENNEFGELSTNNLQQLESIKLEY